MATERADYHVLVERLDGVIDDAATAGLKETAALLRIARLDLLARANGIGEKDLDIFLQALEHGHSSAEGGRAVGEERGLNLLAQGAESVARRVGRSRRAKGSSRRYSRVPT